LAVDVAARTEDAISDSGTPAGSLRSVATRERILEVAERLFAEHGIFAVSNRQVSEAAGQGNNAAVGYHFGTKIDLLRAIVNKHAAPIEQKRKELLADVKGSTDLRDWITCLVRASTDHYNELTGPAWYARFSVQLMADPTLRAVVYEDVSSSELLQKMLGALAACLPDMPDDVRRARGEMARYVMLHMCAERERLLAGDESVEVSNWDDFTTDIVDALVGLWSAPVTR
jgi:AcrR family transcriptional regulator